MVDAPDPDEVAMSGRRCVGASALIGASMVASRAYAQSPAQTKAGDRDAGARNFGPENQRKEAKGETYQQEAEGKSHVGAADKRESSRAMGGENATGLTRSGGKAARTRARKGGGETRDELYEEAKSKGIQGH